MTGLPGRGGSIPQYLCAHFAKSQLWHTSGLFFAFFLTEACGLTPRVMGWVLGLTLFLNGSADLLVGVKLNALVADAAAATRLQLRAAPAVAACFLLFAMTPLVPPDARVIWALATVSGFRLLYPLVDVAQNALVPLTTGDALEQRRWLAARNVVSSLAALSVALIAAPLLIRGQSVTIYIGWAGAIAALLWISSIWLAGVRWPAAPPAPDLPPARTTRRDFPAVLLALAVMMAVTTSFHAMEPYFIASASRRLDLMMWATIGAPLSQPLWLLVIGRYGMTRALPGMATMLVMGAMLLTAPMRTTGAGGMMIGLLFGAGSSGLWLVLWAVMAHGAVPGRALRRVGTFTCVSKLAQGAAVLFVGQVLSLTSCSVTLSDPASPPSRMMVAALVVLAGVAVALAAYLRPVSRTASGGTAALIAAERKAETSSALTAEFGGVQKASISEIRICLTYVRGRPETS
ncbi:MFS transporter [Sphingomonas sp. XXL09]|uniref:MFS transporter n=1 Tax=Sphingomonas sp. XXL09 TaxID=3457787 RepID=UPI00406BCC74